MHVCAIKFGTLQPAGKGEDANEKSEGERERERRKQR
jgi:hypothetical protein